jgi:hypothetical protein
MTDGLMLEKRKDDPGYLRYVHDTPAFVPLPPPLRHIRQRLTLPVSVPGSHN